jgi:hypothetical protein
MEMLRSKLTATTPTSSDLEEGQNEAAAPSFSTDSRPFRERRPRVYASLKTLAIFTVSLIALSIILTTLLPPIDPQDKPKIKLPRSFDDLKQLEQVLQVCHSVSVVYSLGCYFWSLNLEMMDGNDRYIRIGIITGFSDV